MRGSSPINELGSTQLNALSRAMTFLSGSTATEQGVFPSYGSSNTKARVCFFSWEVESDYFSQVMVKKDDVSNVKIGLLKVLEQNN
eukprot:CAMPEP_0184520900 /NCGR_PEP_ID=MMETSP0198_2-20121128/7423_1 /TAXON_ID=1112570 /ORGANISM="Thraustochytrium sp., Strain LLF1b" /LENGTH=85 /DNA_ID=CAMNT_0026911547 /DNA_START=585 /DNA_END=842 /DNA_ORIENTATION=-